MFGYMVRSILTDTYGDIQDTLSIGGTLEESRDVVAAKVAQYAGSYWVLSTQAEDCATFIHSESGADLTIAVEYGRLPVATAH